MDSPRGDHGSSCDSSKSVARSFRFVDDPAHGIPIRLRVALDHNTDALPAAYRGDIANRPMLAFHRPPAAIRMPHASPELRGISLGDEQPFHHSPAIHRLIRESRTGKHPVADARETRLKLPQLPDQWWGKIDRPQHAQVVRVRALGDRRAGIVDILPYQLAYCPNPHSGRLGQHEGEFETNDADFGVMRMLEMRAEPGPRGYSVFGTSRKPVSGWAIPVACDARLGFSRL